MNSEATPNIEIERRFLLDALPVLPDGAIAVRIRQGYFPDGDDGGEGRIRHAIDANGKVRCTHTIKRGVGIRREEIEREISVAEFEEHWARTTGRTLTKTRYRVPVRSGGATLHWEIDAFDDFDLVLVEIELPTEDHAFEMPAWLAPHVVREVTNERAYNNHQLATVGLPASTEN